MEKRRFISRPLSQSEGFAHIEAYIESGLTPAQYYRSHNLSEWQFYQWRKRYISVHPNALQSGKPKKRFHRVRIESPCDSMSTFSGLEIHYPHGVKVVVAHDHRLDMEQLAQLIKISI